jgi:hypothetical protein
MVNPAQFPMEINNRGDEGFWRGVAWRLHGRFCRPFA